MEQARYFISCSATLQECELLEEELKDRRKMLTPRKLDLAKIQGMINWGVNRYWSVVAWQKEVVEPLNNRISQDFKAALQEFVPNYEFMTEEQIARDFEQAYRRETGKLLVEIERQMQSK